MRTNGREVEGTKQGREEEQWEVKIVDEVDSRRERSMEGGGEKKGGKSKGIEAVKKLKEKKGNEVKNKRGKEVERQQMRKGSEGEEREQNSKERRKLRAEREEEEGNISAGEGEEA